MAGPLPYHSAVDEDPERATLKGSTPHLAHRMRHQSSILALALSSKHIFAGTQGGEILVYSLDTYERQRVIEAHRGSVLGFCLSQDQALLFSTATDPIVNVSMAKDTLYGVMANCP